MADERPASSHAVSSETWRLAQFQVLRRWQSGIYQIFGILSCSIKIESASSSRRSFPSSWRSAADPPGECGVFDGTELNQGFIHEGRRITLKGAAGIRFPAGFSIPISIAAARNGPYGLDDIGDDGLDMTLPGRRADWPDRERPASRFDLFRSAWAFLPAPRTKDPPDAVALGSCRRLSPP
jgi:hypothetical protein